LFSRESFSSLTNWLADAQTLASPEIVIVLVGHKNDLDRQRQVSYEEASDYAQQRGVFKYSFRIVCSVICAITHV
jgi:GTPase SAR1 family protein